MLKNLDNSTSNVVTASLLCMLGWHLLIILGVPPNSYLDAGRSHLAYLGGLITLISPSAFVFSVVLFLAAILRKPQAGFLAMFGYTVILLVVAISAFKEGYIRIGVLYTGFSLTSGVASGALFRAWRPRRHVTK